MDCLKLLDHLRVKNGVEYSSSFFGAMKLGE